MKITASFNNFTRGKADTSLSGRDNIPLYTNTYPEFENMQSTIKGNANYRGGMKYQQPAQDGKLVLFRFNREQAYVLLFRNSTIEFFSFTSDGTLGVLLNSSLPVTLTNPYTLAQSKAIDFDQSADVMYVVHPDLPPRKIIRTGATTFTIGTYTITATPFGGSVGYPRTVVFFEGRVWYGGATNKPVTYYGSRSGDYDNFTIDSPITDASAIIATSSDTSSPILWGAHGERSLFFGTDEGILVLNGGESESRITPQTVESRLSYVQGVAPVKPVSDNGRIFYVANDTQNVNNFSYDVLTESFFAPSLNLLSYEVMNSGIKRIETVNGETIYKYALTNDGRLVSFFFSKEEGDLASFHEITTNGKVLDIVSAPRPNGQDVLVCLVSRETGVSLETLEVPQNIKSRDTFYTGNKEADDAAYNRYVSEIVKTDIFLDSSQSFNDHKTTTITFNGVDTVTASGSSFAASDVGKFIVYKSVTGYEYGRFKITEYTSATSVKVEVITSPSSNSTSSWFKTFTSVSGVSRLNGQTVSVVVDGGYLGDFPVSGGVVDFGVHATTVVIGYKYRGVIKTFTLGVALPTGQNSQTNLKSVVDIHVRAVQSIGGSVGTDQYNLRPVQSMGQSMLNYYITPVLDGTKKVTITDTNLVDKQVVFVQDVPARFNLCSLYVEVEHGAKS